MKKILLICSLLLSISAQAEYNWKTEQFAYERDACAEGVSEALVLTSMQEMFRNAGKESNDFASDPVGKGLDIGLKAGSKARSSVLAST